MDTPLTSRGLERVIVARQSSFRDENHRAMVTLLLECGHTVTRRDNHQKTAYCPLCEPPPAYADDRRSSTAQVNRRRERLRAKGLCPRCGKRPPVADADQCAVCQQNSSTSYALWREKRRQLGVCVQCQAPCPKGKLHCRGCLDRANQRGWEWRAQGLCPNCGGTPLATGRVWCVPCCLKAKAAQAERISYALAQGLCIRCQRRESLSGNMKCEECYYKTTSSEIFKASARWHDLKTLFMGQESRCALSGIPLQLGVDTEVDHIIPRSRGGTNDLTNLQWVHAAINRLKDNLLEGDELWPLIKALYTHMCARGYN